MVQPKTAIACRDAVELKVCLDILKKEGHTSNLGGLAIPARIYVYPKGHHEYRQENDDLEYNIGSDVDNCEEEDKEIDDFEWDYVEASDIFRNQIISAQLKGG